MSIQIITPYSIRLGVAGAGTMGSGIALTALYAGMLVTLYDVSAEMLDRAREYAGKHLDRKNKAGSLRNLTLTTDLNDLRGAGVVIEAVPEDLALKESLFSRLDEICPPPSILATNTSTLPVTAIAAATTTPERVAGMHFFNPAPVLPLVEVVRGARTHPDAVKTLTDLAKLLGKTPVVAGDTPGFIVNRVARPFYGEALRLLGEGAAGHEEIDRLVRLGGGFRMGPFQLMDLIGIDINFAAMQSMWKQTFREPRYRPHHIQAQMVQQKALGRKTGRGFYSYGENTEINDPRPPRRVARGGTVSWAAGSWAPGFAGRCQAGGYQVAEPDSEQPVIGIVPAGKEEGLAEQVADLDRRLPSGVPLLVQCADTTLAEAAGETEHPQRLVGFDGLFAANGPIVTLVAGQDLAPEVRSRVESFFRGLGCLHVWVEDTPGLVLPRIICMLANEAAFAVAEGVAEATTIDQAMRLGTNYPKGPLEWAENLGYRKTVSVLDHLFNEYHEERYRAAPLLRRWARYERSEK